MANELGGNARSAAQINLELKEANKAISDLQKHALQLERNSKDRLKV